MAGTQTTSVRSASIVNGTRQYAITTTCTTVGTLADPGIFLLSIVNVEDPKDDALVRVISIADIPEYKLNRDQAINAGDPYWRSSSVTLRFEDIETANAAWKELESRITTLVKQVDAFNAEFETPGAGTVTVHPTVDQSVINALEAAYYASLPTITAAEDARDTEQLACTARETELLVVEDRLKEAEADLATYLAVQSSISNINANLPSIHTTIVNSTTQAKTEVEASVATSSEKSSIGAQLTGVLTQATLFAAQNTALNSILTGSLAAVISTLHARITSLTTERSALRTQLTMCAIEMAELNAAVNAARAARDTALADVLTVCPDFTP